MNIPGSCKLLLALALLSLVAFSLALMLGSYPITIEQLLHNLFSHDETIVHHVIWDLRLPRAMNAFVVGGSLALAGCLLQVLLQNPLADPYILGISGGCSVAMLLCVLFGLPLLLQPALSFAGALLALGLLLSLLRFDVRHSQTLLLIGVMLAMGFGAVTSLLLALGQNTQLATMLRWLMGDLSTDQLPTLAGVVLLIGLLWSVRLARPLNLLCHGSLAAQIRGVSIVRLQWQLLMLASLLTAMATAQAGTIGFIGLIIPHVLRLLGCADYRRLLPASVLAGGCLLLLADTLARTLLSPQQLPVGVITALLGIPIAFTLLARQKATNDM